MPTASSGPTIHADMTVTEILTLLPDAEQLLADYGLHCFSCHLASSETLREGYATHGFAHDRLDDLVQDLNTLLSEQPQRPQELHVTKDAAEALLQIVRQQNEGEYLEVIADNRGAFCLEMRMEKSEDHHVFGHDDVPDLTIVAVPLTLQRIGGSTIDFREGRFKLDLPSNGGGCCQGKDGGGCGCKS